MSYKQFMQELEDDVSPVEAQRRCSMLNHFSFWQTYISTTTSISLKCDKSIILLCTLYFQYG
jgi:hypothetical protein